MTNKTVKFIAASAIAISAVGATATISSTDAFASSITQKSGDATKGKLEVVTNEFATYESAENFAFGELEQILTGFAYKNSVTPTASNKYEVSAVIDYGEITPKAEVETVAQKVIAAADKAIAGSQDVKPGQPVQPEKPSEDPVKPDQPQDDTVKPSEPTEAKGDQSNGGKANVQEALPEAPINHPEANVQEALPEGQVPADEAKNDDVKKDEVAKDEIKKDEVKKDDAVKAEKVNEDKTLPKTAETSSSIASIFTGIFAIAMAGIIAVRKKFAK